MTSTLSARVGHLNPRWNQPSSEEDALVSFLLSPDSTENNISFILLCTWISSYLSDIFYLHEMFYQFALKLSGKV